MPQTPCLLAIDQGTTSSRAIVFKAEDLQILAVAQREFTQHYPHAGWVEHDPQEIWSTTLEVLRDANGQAEAAGYAVAAVGITNQRETSLVWDRRTGEAIHRAIVWQDRRTTERCEQLRAEGAEDEVTARTGLLLDPYFSATKAAWILDHVEGARARAERGELAFGTVDSFLLYHLTGGQVHATDVTNASRTSLYDIHQMAWSEELCRVFRVPQAILPEVHPCLHHFGDLAPALLGRAVPVYGIAGDQQAAAIGQGCCSRGSRKCTYGTGCFALVNTGREAITSRNRLLTTVAYQIGGELAYALEGSIFVAGAAVQWLRDELGLLGDAAESEALAASLSDNDGVYLVPAFTGLGAPHWNPTARGAVLGLTRGSTRAHFARAALEAVCYQTHDLLTAMTQDGITPSGLRVDGGMVANDWLLQFLADTIDLPVERPANLESTALGAAYLAGRGVGLCGDFETFQGGGGALQHFAPASDPSTRARRLSGWAKAVASVLA